MWVSHARVLFFGGGVPIIRIIVFRGLYGVPLLWEITIECVRGRPIGWNMELGCLSFSLFPGC